MASQNNTFNGNDISRRDLLKGFGFAMLGVAAAPVISGLAFPEEAHAATSSAKLLTTGKTKKSTSGKKCPARIHVMWYGFQDAIILESNGHFGIVDSGEDANYPSGNDSRYPWRGGIMTAGWRVHDDEFVSYLKKLGAKPGNVDFYIGTHAHSDHIGTAPRVFDVFKPKKIYTPEYSDSYLTSGLWDNRWVYDRMMEAARRNNLKVITDFKGRESFKLGDMKIKLFNTDGYYKNHPVCDANDMSLGVIVEANGVRAFLAGDIGDREGLEDKIVRQVGKVDLLKVGHHGQDDATSSRLLAGLSPEVLSVTDPVAHMGAYAFDRMRKSGAILCDQVRTATLNHHATVYELSSKGLLVDGKTVPKFSYSGGHLRASRGCSPCEFTGFVSFKNRWYYFNHSTKSLRNAWKKLDGAWYRFGAKGELCYGWQKIGGKYYYMNPRSGQMRTGWLQHNGNWYYLDGSGAMATGSRQIDGTWYKFGKNGAMR